MSARDELIKTLQKADAIAHAASKEIITKKRSVVNGKDSDFNYADLGDANRVLEILTELAEVLHIEVEEL